MPETHELQDKISELKSIEGDGTELVTITVPASKSITSITNRVAQEHAAAENIKYDQTRERVQQALKRIQRILQRYDETPSNGVVIYAGVVDNDLKSYVFDNLPEPVRDSTYRCDSEFDVTPLVNAVTPSETFGVIAIERGEATIGRLVGDRVTPIQTFESQVMGKSRAGGQSAQRFERERERQEHEFFEEVANITTNALIDDGEPVTGLVIGGTLGTAKKFVSNDYLHHELRKRLLGTYSVEYANVQALHQLVKKAEDQLLDAQQRETREHLEEFYSRLRDGDTVAYGRGEIEQAIEFGAVGTALVASSIPPDYRDDLETAVTQQGGEFFVVPTDTEHGSRFAEAFDGIGGLLRFPVE